MENGHWPEYAMAIFWFWKICVKDLLTLCSCYSKWCMKWKDFLNPVSFQQAFYVIYYLLIDSTEMEIFSFSNAKIAIKMWALSWNSTALLFFLGHSHKDCTILYYILLVSLCSMGPTPWCVKDCSQNATKMESGFPCQSLFQEDVH